MKNMKVGQRIAVLIASAIAGLLVVMMLGLNQMSRIFETANFANINTVPSLVALNQADEQFLRLRVRMNRHVQTQDDAKMAELETTIKGTRQKLDQALKDYEATIADDKDRQMFDAEKAAWNRYGELIDPILALSRSHRTEEAQAALAKDIKPANEFMDAIVKHIDYNVGLGKLAAAEALAVKSRATTWSIAIALSTMIAVIAIGFLIARSIVRPLQSAVSVAKAVADGDLTQSVEVLGRDEIGELMAALKTMCVNLNTLIKQTRQSSEEVGSAASELASSSAQIAVGSQQQNDAASAMAAAVEQMTVSVGHIANRADDAATESTESSRVAKENGHVIEDMIQEMNRIAASVNASEEAITELGMQSEQISSVVKVIKEVAEQTNLLALNAAIEAARAGEQGRGFAVVADEVRKLAERTSQSTIDISAMIEKIRGGVQTATRSMHEGVGLVNIGVEKAGQAGSAISQIISGSQRVLDSIKDISAAMQEQNAASTEIAQNVEHIAQMADENNAAVEETSRTANHLASLATDLKNAIGRFRV